MNKTTKKIIIAGAGNAGKTTFVHRHLTGNFQTKYVPTLGVDVNNYDEYKYNYKLWDLAGSEKYSGLDTGYYIGADAVIIMFDVTSKNSFDECIQLISEIQTITNDNKIPIVVYGNKVDLLNRVVQTKKINDIFKKYNIKYYDVSIRSNYNFDKCFEYFDSIFDYNIV